MVNIDIDTHLLKGAQEIGQEQLQDYLQKIVEVATKQEGLESKNIYVSISHATKEEIKRINKKYREMDKETDVLSFPIFTAEELKTSLFQEMNIGDVIVCLDVVKEHSIEYGTGLERELLYIITHGICHLLGYDHEIEQDKVLMRQKEETILTMIGVCNEKRGK